MELISSWVRNITILVLVTAFLMLFLPEGNLRKYVRVVMGFFIITAFIAPFSGLLRGEEGFIYDSIIHSGDEWLQLSVIEAEGQELERAADSVLTEHYEREIGRELKRLLQIYFPEREGSIEVDLDSQFNLERVVVELGGEEGQINIEPVEIDLKERQKGKATAGDQEITGEKMRIKNKISNVFQIPAEVVEIRLEKQGAE